MSIRAERPCMHTCVTELPGIPNTYVYTCTQMHAMMLPPPPPHMHALMHAGGSCHSGRRGDCVRFPVVSKNDFTGCSHMLVRVADCYSLCSKHEECGYPCHLCIFTRLQLAVLSNSALKQTTMDWNVCTIFQLLTWINTKSCMDPVIHLTPVSHTLKKAAMSCWNIWFIQEIWLASELQW